VCGLIGEGPQKILETKKLPLRPRKWRSVPYWGGGGSLEKGGNLTWEGRIRTLEQLLGLENPSRGGGRKEGKGPPGGEKGRSCQGHVVVIHFEGGGLNRGVGKKVLKESKGQQSWYWENLCLL